MNPNHSMTGVAALLAATTMACADLDPLPGEAVVGTILVDRHAEVQAIGVKPGHARNGTQWVYNTFDCADCNWGWNISWSEPGCYIDGGANDCVGYLWIMPMCTTPTELNGEILEAPTYDDGAGNVWHTDVFYDDYVTDAGLWGDPMSLAPLTAFSGHCLVYGTDASKTFVYRYRWFSSDGATEYGSLTFELLAEVDETRHYMATAGTLDYPLDPSETFEFPAEGLLCFDYDNVGPNGEDDSGALNVFLGGDVVDSTYPHPIDLYVMGDNEEEWWLAGGFGQPDLPLDADHQDLLTSGVLTHWYYATPNGEAAQGHPAQMGTSGDLFCLADLNGDGVTDQSDLGILLAVYEVSGEGDLDGDGDTDQSDLGILLAEYGCGL